VPVNSVYMPWFYVLINCSFRGTVQKLRRHLNRSLHISHFRKSRFPDPPLVLYDVRRMIQLQQGITMLCRLTPYACYVGPECGRLLLRWWNEYRARWLREGKRGNMKLAEKSCSIINCTLTLRRMHGHQKLKFLSDPSDYCSYDTKWKFDTQLQIEHSPMVWQEHHVYTTFFHPSTSLMWMWGFLTVRKYACVGPFSWHHHRSVIAP